MHLIRRWAASFRPEFSGPIAGVALLLAATLLPAGATLAAVPWDGIDGHVNNGDPPLGGFLFHEILINGHFETGELAPWQIAGPTRPDEWTVLQGNHGSPPFGPLDGSHFASPFAAGGVWSAGETTTLRQTGTLPATHTGTALVRFEAIWSYDAIAFALNWLDESGSILRHDDLGEYGGQPGAGNDLHHELYSIPAGATHVTFIASARLADGVWLDAGFDDASIVIAAPVPEPAVAGVAAIALPLLLRRRRG